MRRILLLVPDLEYRGHARHAAQLATGLPRDQFEVAVAALSSEGPVGASLAESGVRPQYFKRGYRFDFQHWLALRRLIGEWQPDLIHVWGLDALRTLRYASLFRKSPLSPIVLSLPPSLLKSRRLKWSERRLISHVSRLIATCESDQQSFIAAGLPLENTRLIHPGISTARPSARIDVPPGPLLMTVGHMTGFGRQMDSIWVAEILSYVVPQLQVVVIGAGSFQERIFSYFRGMPRIANRVHLLGARADAAALLEQADVALVPHRKLGGTLTTLEAMAAGCAVVATRLPHLEAIIRDGQTGMLATPGDQPAIARACLRLFENPEMRQAIGAAAREAVLRDFALDTMIARFATTYDEASMR